MKTSFFFLFFIFILFFVASFNVRAQGTCEASSVFNQYDGWYCKVTNNGCNQGYSTSTSFNDGSKTCSCSCVEKNTPSPPQCTPNIKSDECSTNDGCTGSQDKAYECVEESYKDNCGNSRTYMKCESKPCPEGSLNCDKKGECETTGECCDNKDCDYLEATETEIAVCDEATHKCMVSSLLECDEDHPCDSPYECDLSSYRCVLKTCGDGELNNGEECDYAKVSGKLLTDKSVSELVCGDARFKYCDPEKCQLICPSIEDDLELSLDLPDLEGSDGLCTKGKNDGLDKGCDDLNCHNNDFWEWSDELFYFTSFSPEGWPHSFHKTDKSTVSIYFTFSGSGAYSKVKYKTQYISDDFVDDFREYILEATGKDGLEFYEAFGFYPWELYDDIIFAHCDSDGWVDGKCDDDSSPNDFFSVLPSLVDKDGKDYDLSAYTEVGFSSIESIKFGPGEYSPRCVVAQRGKYSEKQCDDGGTGKQKVDWHYLQDGTPCGEGFVCKKGKCVNLSALTCGNYNLESQEECEKLDSGEWTFIVGGKSYGPYGDGEAPSCSDYNSEYVKGNLSCSDTCMIDTSQCKKVGDLCGNGELDEEYEECDSSSGSLPAEGTNAIFSEDYPTSGLCSDYEPDRYESGLLVCTDQCTINSSECVEKPNNESHYENGCSDEENNDVYFDKAKDCFQNDKVNCLDCRDKDCDGFLGNENGSLCEFDQELSCNDGFDNDGDGLVDRKDNGDCIGNLQSYDGSFGVCSTQNRTKYGSIKVNPCYHHDEGCVVSGTIMEDFLCHDGVWYPRQGMGFALLQNKKANNVKIRCDSSPEKIFNNIDYFADLRDVSGILSSCVESACYLVSEDEKAVLLNVQPHELCIDSQSFPSYIFAEIGYDDFSNNDITSFESVDAGNGFYLFYNNYSKQLIYSNFGDFSPIFKDDESVLATLYKKLETQGKSELLKNASVIDSLMFYQEDNVKILGKKAREYNSEEERAGVWYQGTSKGFSDFFSLLFKEACADMGSACNFYPGNGGDLLFIGGKSETPLFSSWWPGYTSLLWESLVE